jgi:GTP 3',8-cyclase
VSRILPVVSTAQRSNVASVPLGRELIKRDQVDPKLVRLSLTDRCDLACTYCRPDDRETYLDSKLSLGEWQRMVDGLLAAGITRFRITGGEPLLSPHLVPIVAYLAKHNVADLALTTNATQLAKRARALRDAGLHRVTISIDSLQPARFSAITRGGDLATVEAGIEAAVAAGFAELKFNTVVLRHQNLDELATITRYAWSRGITPRFLEIMGIGEGQHLGGEFVSRAEMIAALASDPELGLAHVGREDLARDDDRGPARYLSCQPRTPNETQRPRIGFIAGTSDTYCQDCDRVRVASDGKVLPCLAKPDGVEARDALLKDDPHAVVAVIWEAWQQKPDGRTFRGCTEESARKVSIRAIGG